MPLGRTVLYVTIAGILACSDGPSEPRQAGPRFVSVGASSTSTCALTDDGEVYCWGSADYALGRALDDCGGGEYPSPCSLRPARVLTEVKLTQLVLGDIHDVACGTDPEHRLHCWGSWVQNVDFIYRIGDTPQPFEGADVRQVSVGSGHVCAVTGAGEVLCWGDYDGGRRGAISPTGYGSGVDYVPNTVSGPGFLEVYAGFSHSCGRAVNATVWCWGWQGGTGNPQATYSSDDFTCGIFQPCAIEPVATATSRQYTALGGGSCAIALTGAVDCWAGSAPVTIPVPERVTSLSGYDNVCGLTGGGRGYCWRLDRGSYPDHTLHWTTPVAVGGPLRFKVLDAGGSHTCGITLDDRVYCWGENSYGQLGDGTTTPRAEPVPVAAPAPD